MNQDEQIEQISKVYTARYIKEIGDTKKWLDSLYDPTRRKALGNTNPEMLDFVEKHTKDEAVEFFQIRAIGRAVAQALVEGHSLFQ
jgi:hypothetical protein